jgi:hypothetical protein
MDATVLVFRLLDRRLQTLEKRLRQIAFLPESARYIAAQLLRNDAYDFLDGFKVIKIELRQLYLQEQDERYQTAMVEVRMERHEGRGWPYDVQTPKQRRHDTQGLKKLVLCLAEQAAHHDASLDAKQALFTVRLTKIFTVLQDTYGVSLRNLKR